jgi:hypothetical protein
MSRQPKHGSSDIYRSVRLAPKRISVPDSRARRRDGKPLLRLHRLFETNCRLTKFMSVTEKRT